jgi:hypothetical protein
MPHQRGITCPVRAGLFFDVVHQHGLAITKGNQMLQSRVHGDQTSIEFTSNELKAVWASCFALHEHERNILNGAANYEGVKRQDAMETLDSIEAVIRKLNPLLHKYREAELSELLTR